MTSRFKLLSFLATATTALSQNTDNSLDEDNTIIFCAVVILSPIASIYAGYKMGQCLTYLWNRNYQARLATTNAILDDIKIDDIQEHDAKTDAVVFHL